MTEQIDKQADTGNLLSLTTQIVAAQLSNRPMSANELPTLIQEVYASLQEVGTGATPAGALKPAVPIKKSVTASYIVCLEDGRKLKMLKRHLRTAYAMTPDQYRQKWGLPGDYPMVAPNYAELRSTMAKKLGLGLKRKPGRRGNGRK
jgi:predicted transcriptional regulator